MRIDKLTKESLAKVLCDPARDVRVWDATLPGFGVKITPADARIAIYQYRTDGVSRLMTIGRICDALTLDQAKRKAKECAADVLNGKDPQGARVARRNASTVGDLLDLYLESAAFTDKAESTRATDKGRIERHLRPLLGKYIADRVTPDQIAKARNAIEAGKTATVEKTDKLRGKAVVTLRGQ